MFELLTSVFDKVSNFIKSIFNCSEVKARCTADIALHSIWLSILAVFFPVTAAILMLYVVSVNCFLIFWYDVKTSECLAIENWVAA